MARDFAVARGNAAVRTVPGEREPPMSENKRDYEIGRGKPPVHSRFKQGQSGNPRGPRPKNLPALLAEALNEPMVVTIDGERREITKREAVATRWSTNRPVPIFARPRC